MAKVSTTKAMPMLMRLPSACQGLRPLVRRMVNSEVCAMRAITKMVPISTVIGSSSYTWVGMFSATLSTACLSW
ncbi:hypothetical protein D3C72_1209420 [compost metagenome]